MRAQVPEQGMISPRDTSHLVWVEARAFTEQVFRGTVSNAGGESDVDPRDSARNRTELAIWNRKAVYALA